jgi:hypothetical protein
MLLFNPVFQKKQKIPSSFRSLIYDRSLTLTIDSNLTLYIHSTLPPPKTDLLSRLRALLFPNKFTSPTRVLSDSFLLTLLDLHPQAALPGAPARALSQIPTLHHRSTIPPLDTSTKA